MAEGSKAFYAVIGADAALSDAAERKIVDRVMDERVVHRDIAARRARHDPIDDVLPVAEDVERQRARRSVHAGYGIIHLFIGDDRQDGTKDFFLHHRHIGGRIENERRREDPLAPSVCRRTDFDDARALCPRIFDQFLEPGHMACIDDRRIGRISAAAWIELQDRLPIGRDEAFDFVLVQQRIIRRDADLSGIGELAIGDRRRGAFQCKAALDDRRRFAAEFERHRNEIFGRRAHDRATNSGAAGKEQMIEGQSGEVRADIRAAGDDGDLLLRKNLAQHRSRQLRRRWASARTV